MLLSELIDAVLDAGEILKSGYKSIKSIEHKGEVDLVTEYDVLVENRLKESLSYIFKGYSIVAEESYNEDIKSKSAIYIDPIDGTTNFIHNIPFCSISVGVWKDNKPFMGVVYNPILNELFYAKRGEGAYLNGKKISVTHTAQLIKSLVSTGFPYTKVEKGKDYKWVIESMKNLLPITQDIRRLGSASLDLCYVACGRFDAFFECNLKPWDVAAGILIVEESGGTISNHLGKPYILEDFIIVASNGKNHTALLNNLALY